MYQKQLDFKEAVTKDLNNYCVFTGRSSRSEYWWFVLFGCIVSAVCGCFEIFSETLGQWLSYIISLLLFLPNLGLAVRRLHDIGKSGWWLLIGLIPLVGWIILIVWYCQPSQPGANRFGDEPNIVY